MTLSKHIIFVLSILFSFHWAQSQVNVSATGRLDHFDQFIGSGIWDFGSCLGEDVGLPPVIGIPYISANGGKLVKVRGTKMFQKVIHYKNNDCESGQGYTVVRSSPANRSCLAASYNHFCKGAPAHTVLKVGLWDFGNCAGGDRHFCPGLGYSAKNGATITYKNKRCASGVARCTVDSAGFGKRKCEIARYIHTCE